MHSFLKVLFLLVLVSIHMMHAMEVGIQTFDEPDIPNELGYEKNELVLKPTGVGSPVDKLIVSFCEDGEYQRLKYYCQIRKPEIIKELVEKRNPVAQVEYFLLYHRIGEISLCTGQEDYDTNMIKSIESLEDAMLQTFPPAQYVYGRYCQAYDKYYWISYIYLSTIPRLIGEDYYYHLGAIKTMVNYYKFAPSIDLNDSFYQVWHAHWKYLVDKYRIAE